ncbi:adenylyltransferase/cytidyltransferase family protein [Blastococcus sp. SYSU D00813]
MEEELLSRAVAGAGLPGGVPTLVNPSGRVVITFGTFDVFHVGHLRILERARALGDRLVVGVSSDGLNIAKKGRPPVFPEDERMAIVRAVRWVDDVFLEESLEAKADYIAAVGADVLVMGDDWAGRFDGMSELCEVVYLPRTPSISTSATIERIQTVAPAASGGRAPSRGAAA